MIDRDRTFDRLMAATRKRKAEPQPESRQYATRRTTEWIAPAVVQTAHQADLRFLEKWENLRSALALRFASYNFCRVHSSLRVTPAMEAGITDHVWSIAELLA